MPEIENPAAPHAMNMMVAFRIGVEPPDASRRLHYGYKSHRRKRKKSAVDGLKGNTGKVFSDPAIDVICRRMIGTSLQKRVNRRPLRRYLQIALPAEGKKTLEIALNYVYFCHNLILHLFIALREPLERY